MAMQGAGAAVVRLSGRGSLPEGPGLEGLAVTDFPEGLAAIRRPEVAAALWRRRLPENFRDWLDGLDPDSLPRARMILRPDALRPALEVLARDMPASPERARLTGDIAAMADLFAGLMPAAFLRLRLDVVTGDACRKFHLDAVTARLVCTYRGSGTEIGLASGGGTPARIVTVPTGAPVLLRGTLWPVRPDPGLLHRSPPIAGTGETRLVLVLDPVDDPGDAV